MLLNIRVGARVLPKVDHSSRRPSVQCRSVGVPAGRGLVLTPFVPQVSDCSSEDSGSRRDSSSDTFCTATKEGLLHFKQLHSDKNKVRPALMPYKS